jgi:hypothetical protein
MILTTLLFVGAEYTKIFVKLHLKNNLGGFQWVLMAVYGATQLGGKEHFLAELVNAVTAESLPLVVGSDFNIIRNPSEKNNNMFNGRWPALFNAYIESLNLRELEFSGLRLTWASSALVLTYEKLDSPQTGNKNSPSLRLRPYVEKSQITHHYCLILVMLLIEEIARISRLN